MKKRALYLVILIALTACYILLSDRVTNDDISMKQNLFLVMLLIVVLTVVLLMSFIQMRFPTFLEKGVWERTGFVFISLLLLLLVIVSFVILSIWNHVEMSPLINRLSTVVASYPVIFIFIMMFYLFTKPILKINKETRLFMSGSFIIVLYLLIIGF